MKSARDRFWSKVNKTDSCWLWTAATTNGYGVFHDGSRLVRAHRYSYEALVGPIAPGLEIDHLCHVPACVNPEHLQAVTHKRNLENRRSANSNSKSGVRGVGWYARDGRWFVQVKHNGKSRHVGYFDDLAEAEAAAIRARAALFTNDHTTPLLGNHAEWGISDLELL